MDQLDMHATRLAVVLAVLSCMIYVRVDGQVITNTTTYTGQTATIICPLQGNYTFKSWSGPPNDTIYSFAGYSNINPNLDNVDRLSVAVNQRKVVITNVTKSDAGTYTCLVIISGRSVEGRNTLIVRIRPQTPVISDIQPNGTVVSTEGRPLPLTCTSRGGNPAPTVTWYRGTTQFIALSSSSTGPLEADGYIVTANYTFTPARADDGDVYVCQPSSTSPPVIIMDSVNMTLRLNLKPSPPTVEQVGDVDAGSFVTVRCTTSGFRPDTDINMTWAYKGSPLTPVATQSITGTDTYTATSTIRFPVQKADNGGRSECTVWHPTTLEAALTASTTIAVRYPPDVVATATINGQFVDLTCSPSGVPSIYLYSSWVQSWPGYGEITRPILEAAATLRLSNLTYAHSGVYTCRVSNGVAPYGTSELIRTASTAALSIKSRPVIITPNNTVNDINKFVVKLGHPASVTSTYYSPSTPTLVSCYKVIGNVRQSPPVGTVTTEATQINLHVFSSIVLTLGTRSTVTWTIVAESGLGVYDIVLTNVIGEASVLMEVVMEGPPDSPEHFNVLNIQPTRVDVSWRSGFHGGYPQTTVVQYSTDSVTWTDGPSLDTGVNVSRELNQVTVASLRPGTHYYLRMYAHNELGSSPDTSVLNIKTDAYGVAASSFGEGAATGAGTVAAAVIAIGIIVTGVFYKKGYRIRHGKGVTKYTGSEQTYVNDTMTDEVPEQRRIDSEMLENYIVPISDSAPATHEMMDSAGTVDSHTYTQIGLRGIDSTMSDNYIVPISDSAPATHEMLDSAGTVDSHTYTRIGLLGIVSAISDNYIVPISDGAPARYEMLHSARTVDSHAYTDLGL